jgi:hypothetical protein
MYFKRMVAIAALTAAASGCAYGIKAASDFDRQVDFATYDTFFMLKGNSSGDAITDERLMSDVKGALMAKGWLEVPVGDGEAAVVIHTATGDSHSDESFYSGWGGWQWRWTDSNDSGAVIEDYKPGAVVVTIFDADTKQAIWRGYATDVLTSKPKDAVKVREEAVSRIFAKFPPVQ